MSLVEVIIAVVITSILVAGAYKLYQYTMTSANRERDKAQLQGSIITLTNIIEKDIRMAGCGLPGNGLQVNLHDNASDSLRLFTNESGRETKLTMALDPTLTRAIVDDATGFAIEGGICFAAPGVDTVYRNIIRVGIQGAGNDTVDFDAATNTTLSFPVNAPVYPAVCIRYTVSGTGSARVISRARNNAVSPLGTDLDSINLVPKDALGTPVVGVFKNVAVMTVVVGGHVGRGGNRVFIADSTEVNIRNRI